MLLQVGWFALWLCGVSYVVGSSPFVVSAAGGVELAYDSTLKQSVAFLFVAGLWIGSFLGHLAQVTPHPHI